MAGKEESEPKARKSAGSKTQKKAPRVKVREESQASTPGMPRVRPQPEARLSRSLEFGVAIIECFSPTTLTLGIADIAEAVGITRSTTHRYAMTLVTLGYLEQDSNRKYRLSRKAAEPGMSVLGALRRNLAVGAALEELREEVGYTVSLGVLDRSRVTYVYRLLGHRPGQYAIDQDMGVGAGVPAYCTALGKVLLASLPAAERKELLASLELVPQGPKSITMKGQLAAELESIDVRYPLVSDEEFIQGGRSIAMFLSRPGSEHRLAIEVTVPSNAYTADQLDKTIGPRLRHTAKLISGE